jgi:acetolactate decarboxylase
LAAVCLLGPHQILHARVVVEQVKGPGGEGEAGERRLSPLARPKGNATASPLQERCRRSGESLDHGINCALAEALDLDHHTIYQISTSGALVQGAYSGCVRVGTLLQHGDFGLGTFDGLDGEGILLDGCCWQARSDGSVVKAPADALLHQ